MERVQFHESIKKANKNQEVTFHGSPEQLEHAKAIIWMFATRPNRGANKSSSLPFCVQTVTGLTQLVHFINIC